MTRDEVVIERDKAVAHHAQLKKLGEFDANAGTGLKNAESIAKVWEHLLSRMR